MELIELYNQIQNPIDDSRVIERLIKAYADSSNGLGGFYGQLTKSFYKEYNKGQYYQEDADKFYAMMFNKWKNSIVSMKKDEFKELYRQGSYGLDFIKMREYLKNIPDVSTMQEANTIFDSKKGDAELENALEKYKWNSFGEYSGWVHVCSRYVTAKKDTYPNIEHRLYLNTESLDIYKMITFFILKCDQYHLPYYFKFDQYANRDDTIVIYSSTENLTKYIEILQEIKEEYPELVSRSKEPPLLTGKIDDWIGYGTEPSKTNNGEKQSFNGVRAKLIEQVIDQTTKKWILNHKDNLVKYQCQKMTFKDYIAMKATENFIYELERRFILYEDNYKKNTKDTGSQYNQTDIINKLGYSLQDVRSSNFKQQIYIVLKQNIESLLFKVCNGGYVEPIVMNVRNGKQISFRDYNLESTIKHLSTIISKNDSNFISNIQVEIKNNAWKYSIDEEKFCFDVQMREKIKLMELATQGNERKR